MDGVAQSQMFRESRAPLVIERVDTRLDLSTFARLQARTIKAKLLTHGAILFRGFDVHSTLQFDQFVRSVSKARLDYCGGISPRKELQQGIFTSTEYPARLNIELHNECSYLRSYPSKIAFCCVQTAATGGETPIADLRSVTSSIDPEVFEKFATRSVTYIKNFSPEVDVPWQKAFNASSKEILAERCNELGITHEWLTDGTLRTTHTAQGATRHKKTGELLFFNQAHLFHLSGLGERAYSAALKHFGPDRLPKHATFGDGSEIPLNDLAGIRVVLAKHSVSFPWRKGDILLIDNLQIMHGRRAFTGSRLILTALLDMCSPGNAALPDRDLWTRQDAHADGDMGDDTE